MAEVRNTFIKSKMNKDLDARILPAGEYRDAVNVTVSTSEGADVGALENILGNKLLPNFGISTTDIGVELIGLREEPGKNRIFGFFTNYVDASDDNLSNPASKDSHCSIVVYDITTGTQISLVAGGFLNFSKTHPIFGINIIEDLLFWTDNRNQPRQINIESAIVNPSNNINPYYTIEENISVAKYYPFESPKVYSEEIITVSVSTTTTNWGTISTPNNYPQMLFESTCTITSGSPTMKLHPGLKFELISTVEGAYPDPVNPELTYPYQNEIKKYLFQPFIQTGTGSSVADIGITEPLWFVNPWNSTDQPSYNPPDPLKFISNIPFHYLDTNGVQQPWQGTATLKMVEQDAISVTEKWLKPTYRFPFINYATSSLAPTGDFLTSQGTAGVSNFHELPIPFMWPGTGGGQPPTDQDAVDYQESIGSRLVNISTGAIGNLTAPANAYGVGNSFGSSSKFDYYYRRWFCNYLQPGMKVSWPAMLEDDSSYIIDQIFGSSGPTSFGGAGNPFDTANYLSLSIRKIDKNGKPVKEWQWPIFDIDSFTGGTAVPLLSFSFENPYYDEKFGGNETFFEEKFCRLAYRFVYDSNETSLISPFTQSLFKPKQEGFYLYSDDYAGFAEGGDATFQNINTMPESDANRVGLSTNNFLYENSINRVNVNISMPVVNNEQLKVNEISSVLKIKQIDIIYEDSASTNLLILKSISVDDVSIVGNTDTNYTYKWEGDKPFRTLPSSEATRTSDMVPIRALSQEVSGNRVIYGNFVNRHTSPEFLDYSVGIGRKYTVQQKFSSMSGIEYPNHTLKQNRIYQVGVVLSDKYGRQSDVILAPPVFSTDTADNSIFSGDTFFSSYFKRNEVSGLVSSSSSNIVNWIGSSLKMLWNSTIPKSISGLQGYPGLYTLLGSVNNLDIDSSDVNAGYITSKNVATTTNSIGSGLTVDIIATAITTGPGGGGGQITSVNINNPGIGYEIGDIVDVSGGTILTRLTIVGVNEANDLGWYSFKVVVKQQQQQYYNIYMPTIINGEPLLSNPDYIGPPGDLRAIAPNTNNLACFSLIGDNINKIPVVVTESNSQIAYSSSEVKLYPRVSQFGNLWFDPDISNGGWKPSNTNIITGVVDLDGGYDSVIYVGNIEDLYNGASRDSINEPTSSDQLVDAVYSTALFKQPDNPYSIVSENTNARSPFTYFDIDSVRSDSQPYAAISDFLGYPVNTGMGINTYKGQTAGATQINYTGGVLENGYLTPNNIAVVEVEAFESDLDIFWETSTAGLIDELNYLIENNSDEGLTAILSRQDNDFTESSPTTLFEGYWLAQSTPIPVNNLVPTASIDPYIISLKPINALNQQVPLSRIASVVMTVMDNNGTDVSSQFLISNDANASVSIYKIYLVNNPQTFLQDSAIRNFTCSITITSTPAFVGGNPVISNFTETLTLQNEIPVLVNAGSNTGITPIVTGVGGTFWGDDGTTATANAQSPSYRNGAYVNADAGTVGGYLSRGFSIETTKEIVWSFVSCIETTSGVDIVSTLSLGEGSSGKVVDLNAGVVGAIQMYVNKNYFVADVTAEPGTYELIYRITDASGDGSVYEYPTTESLTSLIFSIA